MNKKHPFQAVAAILACLFLLTPCGRAATTNVTYGDYSFIPAVVTINAGDTVNWVARNTDLHTLLGTGGDPICGGSPLPCAHTFNTAGNFSYVCTLHVRLGMTGMVMVVSAPVPQPPIILTQPQSQSVLTNTTVTFSVTASNATSYQWQNNFVNLPGQTNDSLTLTNVTLDDSGAYQVVVGNAVGPVTSSNAVLVVKTISAPVITAQPESQVVLTNTSVTFSVTASNGLSYQWLSNSITLPGQTGATLTLNDVVIGESGSYQVIVGNPSGSAASSVAVLLVGYPASFVQQPANVDVLAGTLVTLQAEATGYPPPQYQWAYNNVNLPGQQSPALALDAVTTNLQGAYSVSISNAFGSRTSSNAILTVEPLTTTLKEKLTITVSPPGSGTVSPNYNGRSLIAAHRYTVTAIGGRGEVFADWSGIAQSQNRTLTFVMPSTSNAVLTANFIPSPFTNAVAGTYSGLFWDPANLSNETAGYFTATISATGAMAGQLRLAGATLPFATNLYPDGSAIVRLKRRSLNSLILTTQVDLAGLATLSGSVTDTNGSFHAPLFARRAASSDAHRASGYAGYYTWAMPGISDGYSYGTASVASLGAVRLSLFLSDGPSSVASGALSANGQMPLYLSLYGGKGSLLSWLSFTNSAIRLSTNAAYWFRNTGVKDAYPTLTNLSIWMGVYPAAHLGTNALNAASVSVQLSGADLKHFVTEHIPLNQNGIGGSFPNLVVTISDSAGVFTGLNAGIFTGLFKDPTSGDMVRFNGAVLHQLPMGYGFFSGGHLPGAVIIGPP